MKTELRFEEKEMMVSRLGEEASVPDLMGSLILQNDLTFHLEEEDEIYEAYGRRKTSYPYRQYNAYNRKLEKELIKTAVLENAYIKALFLPELGGRLWELIDKKTGENLLYTNDVIRYSNLAVRNAWFSGGVEWNIGIIGHSPLTTEPLYTASLKDENGNPILRMYEYERVRGLEYQMDFWIGKEDAFLSCRMRVVNSGKETVPMYWWSNMAVPEYGEGRIAVPAEQAFTSRGSDVYKVEIPVVDGVDITRYQDIPKQVDYFFDIPDSSAKFIANLNADGYGLLHLSTGRQRSRKLFSWGHKQGADRWQDFLTEKAGRYLEIQAGLGKTQYGCIPMAPHTAWEWLEQYGAVSVPADVKNGSYEGLVNALDQIVQKQAAEHSPEKVLKESKRMALTEGRLVYGGSGYGQLKRMEREALGDRDLSSHLKFQELDESQKNWWEFARTGRLAEPDMRDRPDCFMCDDIFYEKLKETVKTCNRNNWYAHYQLGIMCLSRGHLKKAEEELLSSQALLDSPWSRHGLASLYMLQSQKEKAAKQTAAGLRMRSGDLSYVKEGFKLLLMAEAYDALIEIYDSLPQTVAGESRVLFDFMMALSKAGKIEAGRELLKVGFVLEDLRECEDSIGELFRMLYPDGGEVPKEWAFNSL